MNENRYIFEDRLHLSNVLRLYREHIFDDIEMSHEFIDFMVDNFIDGYQRLKIIDDFIKVFIKNFIYEQKIDKIHTEYVTDGSYGTIYEINNTDQVVKIIKNDNNKENKHLFRFYEIDKGIIRQFMTETMTYILWITVLKYIESIKLDVDCTSNLATIKRPFIKLYNNKMEEHEDTHDYKYYSIGYIMNIYDVSCGDIFNDSCIDMDCKKHLLKNIVTIIDRIHRLKDMGIVFSHRDMSTNNIMLNEYNDERDNNNSISNIKNIRFIDYGFSCIKIQFNNDNKSFKLGYFFDLYYQCKVEQYYDIIFFVLYVLLYHSGTLNQMNIRCKMSKIVQYRFNRKIIDLTNISNIWRYPYLSDKIDKENVFSNVLNVID